MKKLIFFVLFSGTVIGLNAQDITISFQPKETGIAIDSILVTNLRTSEKIKLIGEETLTLTKVTGISGVSFASEKGYLFPNPCNGKTQLSFTTNLNQVVKVNVYNISGQFLSSESQFLYSGEHRFNIYFPVTGIYNVSILKFDGSLSFKAVCFGPVINRCGIEYRGSEYINQSKSAIIGKTLSYTQGDILLHSVFSGKNNTYITDSPTATKTYSVEFYECIDPDNNSYPIVKIGTQWWTANNLQTFHYSDGTLIPNVTDNAEWAALTTGACCWFYYATSYGNLYGALYNWFAVNTRKLCPFGWHVPSDTEWKQLEMSLGMTQNQADTTGLRGTDQGIPMKSTAGWDTNCNGTNSSGFSGLPDPYRCNKGIFSNIGSDGVWWSSTEDSTNHAWYRNLRYSYTGVLRFSNYKAFGFSIRCVRDSVSFSSVATAIPDSITNSSVYLGGKVTSDGGYAVNERGVCYGTTQSPTIENNKVIMGSGTGTFKSKVTGLTANTTYYARAYAITSLGTTYGGQVTFTTNSVNPSGTFTDPRDDKTYKWIQIGEQVWMAEYLAWLPSVSPPTEESYTAPYYYVYGYNGNDVSAAKVTANYTTYGVLYNWPAALTACPAGWHLPSDAEWKQLEMALGMTKEQADATGLRGTDQGTQMKAISGWNINGIGTNTSGFSGLPGGNRLEGGTFNYIGDFGYWWSSTEYSTARAWYRSLSCISTRVYCHATNKEYGFSVRCLRDN